MNKSCKLSYVYIFFYIIIPSMSLLREGFTRKDFNEIFVVVVISCTYEEDFRESNLGFRVHRMQKVAELIMSFPEERPIIVFSAMGKTTNNLLKVCFNNLLKVLQIGQLERIGRLQQ
jgi:hypothetical protein